MKPYIPGRELVEHEAGVALFFKPLINYALFDVDDEGSVLLQTGEWFQLGEVELAVARYEARVVEAKKFL